MVWLSSFLDTIGTATKLEVVIGLLLGLITLLSIIGRVIWRVTRVIYEQLDAMKANTKAVRELTIGLANLEEVTHDRLDLLEQKVDAVDLAGTKGLHNHIESLRREIQNQ